MLIVDIFIDGNVNIDYSVYPDPMLPRINITIPGCNYTDLLAYDEDGLIMDWEQNSDGIEVDSIGAEELTISYSSFLLTNRTGSLYTVSLESPVSTLFILPLEAILVRISTTPTGISIMDNRAVITMPQGFNSISYKLGSTGTKEHSVVLLSRASIKIYQATDMGVNVNHSKTLLIQASQAYEAGEYLLSEQLSKQIIREIVIIIELARQAQSQITKTEDLINLKTGSVSQEIIDSANILLSEAKQSYFVGNYTSANKKAFEAYTLIQNASPLQTGLYYLIIGLGIVIFLGTEVYYLKNKEKQKTPFEISIKKILTNPCYHLSLTIPK
jgi:hypothetical protein